MRTVTVSVAALLLVLAACESETKPPVQYVPLDSPALAQKSAKQAKPKPPAKPEKVEEEEEEEPPPPPPPKKPAPPAKPSVLTPPPDPTVANLPSYMQGSGWFCFRDITHDKYDPASFSACYRTLKECAAQRTAHKADMKSDGIVETLSACEAIKNAACFMARNTLQDLTFPMCEASWASCLKAMKLTSRPPDWLTSEHCVAIP